MNEHMLKRQTIGRDFWVYLVWAVTVIYTWYIYIFESEAWLAVVVVESKKEEPDQRTGRGVAAAVTVFYRLLPTRENNEMMADRVPMLQS